jgi:hypothetical protein
MPVNLLSQPVIPPIHIRPPKNTLPTLFIYNPHPVSNHLRIKTTNQNVSYLTLMVDTQ